MDYKSFYDKYLGNGTKASGNNIRYKCWRSECRAKAGNTLVVNLLTGQYVCHRCENNIDGLGKGNTRSFSKALKLHNVQTLTPTIVTEVKDIFDQELANKVYTYLIEHSTLNDEHKLEISNKRGIKNPELHPYNLRSTDDAEALLFDKFSENELTKVGLVYRRDSDYKLISQGTIWSNRVLIPYYDKDGYVGFIRSRSNNSVRKYTSPIGAKARDRIWGFFNPNDTHVIITEGEFKAMAAVEHGFNCLALPGMNTSYEKFKILCIENFIKEVTICFDTQIDSEIAQANVDGAIRKLANTIKKDSGIKVYRANLPIDKDIGDGLKSDIDQYILIKGPDAFYDVIVSAQEI